MFYLKNSEVAKKFNVSPNAVGNWVEKARRGKIPLVLVEKDGHLRIINTSDNLNLLKDLAKKGRKYKNKSLITTVEVKERFYKIFNEKQTIEIITSLEKYKEIPYKYTFLDIGAIYWDKYIKKSLNRTDPNVILNTIELLDISKEYILTYFKNVQKINVIDIGVGNGCTVKSFLEFLQSKNILGKYIGLDFSKDLLKSTDENIQKWFGNSIPSEGYIMDINSDSFEDLIFKNTSFTEDEPQIGNLILYIGSTLSNQKNPEYSLANIRKSMGKHDLLLIGQTLNTENAKLYFDLSYEDNIPFTGEVKKLTWLIELMGITPEHYSFEKFYNEVEQSWQMIIKMNTDLNMIFDFNSIKKEVFLHKNDKVLLWRHKHNSYRDSVNLILDNDFEVLHTATTVDRSNIITTCKINSI